MRLVHISDPHLGFRQYQRLTPEGVNQREADVARAFQIAIGKTLEIRPELVLIAGDMFHTVRPSNPAILHAFNNLARLVEELPDSPVIVVAGNHDLPRARETGCILHLFRELGVRVVDAAPERLFFPELDLAVLAVPDLAGTPLELDPDPEWSRNILLLHGEVRGVVPPRSAADDRPALQIEPSQLASPRWNYVALGHYHVFRELAPNTFYSGALEYTSTNPWGEIREEQKLGIPGKGFLEFDLSSGEHTFHHVPSPRRFIDLQPLSARGLTSLELDELIRERVELAAEGIENSVVRLVARDVPRHIGRELDQSAIRSYKRRALNFLLDSRRPDGRTTPNRGVTRTRQSLEDTVREKLNSRTLESDMSRQALIELGLRYLSEAEAADAARMEADG